ncbi:MAG: response regulator [Methanoregula sp.]|nr:response regulator [Methanoregula sp.]
MPPDPTSDCWSAGNTFREFGMEKNILIVEDQAIVAMTIETQLVELGYKVAGVAATGEAAIQLAREKKPDLVLMDINLEGEMDGITAAEHIGLFLDSPIIYLTAYSDAETIRRAGLTSPFTYLTKPYKMRDLHSNIEMALYKKKLGSKKDLREQRLQTMLKMVSDPLIATDETGAIIFINDPAADLLGIHPSDALEQPLEVVFRMKEQADNPLFTKGDSGGPDVPGLLGFPFQCTLISKGSHEIPLLADLEKNITIILDAIGHPVVIIDPELRIEEYNLAFSDWCREIGITTDLDYKSIRSIAGLLRTIRPAQLTQVLETSTPAIFEEQIVMGKETLVFEVRFVPLEEKGKINHILITIRDITAEQRLQRAAMVPMSENRKLIENIIRHFSDILGSLIEIRSLSSMEDPSVEKDWVSEQIVRYIEKAEKTSSELYEIFLNELSGKHSFQQVYDQKKKQIEREHEYVLKPRK